MLALVFSGVPKAGAPERMSTLEVNAPYITGAPGRTACARVRPNRISAFCWASAAASDTGAIAPISVNGVITTGWPWLAIIIRPSAIASSKRRGLFTEMMVSTPGLSAICSGVRPRVIAIISMPSRARPAPMAVQWKLRSE